MIVMTLTTETSFQQEMFNVLNVTNKYLVLKFNIADNLSECSKDDLPSFPPPDCCLNFPPAGSALPGMGAERSQVRTPFWIEEN